MIRFKSPLPAETLAHHLASAVYPDAAVPAGVVHAAVDSPILPLWELSEGRRHTLSLDGAGYELSDLYECPDRRARFLAVLAELGAEVVT